MSNLSYAPSLRFPFLTGINSVVKQTERILFFVLLLITGSFSSLAQTDTWVQKNDLGYNAIDVAEPQTRGGAVGFSIENKGYIGTGSGVGYLKDFWEYNPVDNAWKQKADFGGTAPSYSVGFSIGNKGYIGTGSAGTSDVTNDFWEYDPAVNAWTQKANFGGTARRHAVGFSIGNKGYVGTGTSTNGDTNDFWEYDPATNAWTQKKDFGGTARSSAVGFSIGSKGYIGTGNDIFPNYYKDFWEYDPITDTWTQKKDFGGTARSSAVGFSIDSKGYVGTGYSYDGTYGYYYKDFWEYDPDLNTWMQKEDMGGDGCAGAVGFSISNKGYVGTGSNNKDFWEFDPAANTWKQKADFGGTARSSAVGFSIGSKGYIGTGNYKDFWEYDPATNTWTQKADFGGGERAGAVGFSIGTKGYIGTGYSGYPDYISYKDFWEYDPASNTWTQKADFGGTARSSAVGFSIGSKGYIGTGSDIYGYRNDFWEYDPATNTWSQKDDFEGCGRSAAVGFSIGNKGYVGTGLCGTYPFVGNQKDFWEYDPVINNWTRMADFGGTAQSYSVGFGIGNKGYVGTGYSTNGETKDFWQYDPATDTWVQKADFRGAARGYAVGFSIGNKGYVGTGLIFTPLYYCKDFWEYAPSEILPLQLLSFTAALQKNDAVLTWQTANEVNTAHFNIQRSYNGNDFTTIAKQNAAGNGSKQEYIYSDEQVTTLQQSTIYYRLQMVDRDGSFTWSNIVQVKLNNSNGILFTIAPNPAKNNLRVSISCAENTTLSIRIVDMQGRQVYANNVAAVSGTVHKDIDISKLAKGMYNIQLISNQGTSKSSFVKE